jgi:RNA polymerase sigma-70 factor (ECF subfamily)
MVSSPNPTTLSGTKLQTLLEHRAKFVSFVHQHVASAHDAEDIVQSAFLRSVEKLESIRQEESVVAWFYRVLRNAIIDHYRRTASNERKFKELALHFSEEAPSSQIHREVCQCILPVVDQLKPEYRDALKYVDIEESSLKDFAAGHSISENNAAVRVHRARQALRKQVQITCGVCATRGCLDCSCSKPLAKGSPLTSEPTG